MKKNKEYKAKMGMRADGTMVVEYVMERVQLNQHKARWVRSDKREFTRVLKSGNVSCK